MNLRINGDTLSLDDLLGLGAENSAEFQSRLRAALTPSCRHVQVDLSQTAYVDSTGLGALLSLHKIARESNCKVRLLNPRPHVQLLFDVTRMNRVFEIVNTQS